MAIIGSIIGDIIGSQYEFKKEFIRNVFKLNCDMDTICAIGGGIAEELFGGTGLDNRAILKKYLTKELYELCMK